MKKTLAKILVAVMIVTVAGASSCKNRGESRKQKEINPVELEALEKKIEENVYPLPTSAEVIKKLTDMDLGYILGATNPPDNARNYVELQSFRQSGCLRSRSQLFHSLQYAAGCD